MVKFYMPVTKYVMDWFKRADDDIGVVLILLHNREEINSNIACFHAQQSAEKYLKGFLASREKNIRKVHDLKEILTVCIGIDNSFIKLAEALEFLNQFYIRTRYPGDYPEGFSWKDAEQALAFAEKVKEFVLKLAV